MECLLIVDLQNDFLPGGALAVPHGDEVCPFINNLLLKPYPLVIASQDWHPKKHCSFLAEGGIWPVHCVQDTFGADFPKSFDPSKIDHLFRKGKDPAADSYSVFFDEKGRPSNCASYLRSKGVDRLDVVGLATDYCVKQSVLDALKEGFKTTVLLAGCRGVNVHPGDADRAIEEMRKAGAIIK